MRLAGLAGAAALAALCLPLSAQRDSLTVFAAADLAHAFEELTPTFTRQTGTAVTLVFGASGSLAIQVERGAPADLFFSANTGFVDRLVRAGVLLGASRTVYARGRLALAWPRGRRPLRNLGDLLRPEVRRVAIANPETAPYGLAAKQALEGRGLWELLQPKLVFGENVRQTLQYAQTGAIEAVIVARSAARVPEVGSLLLAESLHAPIDQAAAVVARSRHARSALEFLAYVTGPGWPVMERNGFGRPSSLP